MDDYYVKESKINTFYEFYEPVTLKKIPSVFQFKVVIFLQITSLIAIVLIAF